MGNIQDLLAQILAARYGKDVRQSIHDAIWQCYEDGHADGEPIAEELQEKIGDTDISSVGETVTEAIALLGSKGFEKIYGALPAPSVGYGFLDGKKARDYDFLGIVFSWNSKTYPIQFIKSETSGTVTYLLSFDDMVSDTDYNKMPWNLSINYTSNAITRSESVIIPHGVGVSEEEEEVIGSEIDSFEIYGFKL